MTVYVVGTHENVFCIKRIYATRQEAEQYMKSISAYGLAIVEVALGEDFPSDWLEDKKTRERK